MSPSQASGRAAVEGAPPVARPRSEWHEDDGPVLWWRFEPGIVNGRPALVSADEPWVGSPLDDNRLVRVTNGWEDVMLRSALEGLFPREGSVSHHYTHWTPLVVPEVPQSMSCADGVGPEEGEVEERWRIRQGAMGCACTHEDAELCEDDGPGFGNAGDYGCTCSCHIGPVWDLSGREP